MRWLVAIALVGCVGSKEDPCAVQRIEPCPDCGPGEVRRGLAAERIWDLSRAADGTLTCTLCNENVRLDRDLAVVTRAPYQEVPSTFYDLGMSYVGRGPDGTFYATTGDALIAYTPAGVERWRHAVANADSLSFVLAAEGPYLYDRDQLSGIVALDNDGVVRWTAPAAEHVFPDEQGGIFTATDEEDISGEGIAVGTLAHIDSSGTQRWSKTLTARREPGPYRTSLFISRIAPTTGGGVAIAGRFLPTLEIDSTTLAGTSESIFAASIDATGQLTWASSVEQPTTFASLTALAPAGDDIVIGGSDYNDAFVMRLAPTGLARMLTLGGSGEQYVSRIVPGDGDEHYFVVRSYNSDIEPYEESRLEIGGKPLPVDEGFDMTYLLAMQL